MPVVTPHPVRVIHAAPGSDKTRFSTDRCLPVERSLIMTYSFTMRHRTLVLANAGLALLGIGSLLVAVHQHAWWFAIGLCLSITAAGLINAARLALGPLHEIAEGLRQGANGVCLFTGLVIAIHVGERLLGDAFGPWNAVGPHLLVAFLLLSVPLATLVKTRSVPAAQVS